MWYVICVCVFCVTTMFIICTSTKDMMTPITNIYKRFKATRSMQTSLRCVSTIAQQTLSKHIPQLSKNLQLPISILKSRNSFNQHLTQILLEHSDIHIYIYIYIHLAMDQLDQYLYIPFTSTHQLFLRSPGLQGFDTSPHIIQISMAFHEELTNDNWTSFEPMGKVGKRHNVGLVYVRQVSLVRWT